ncbi:MAG TPA: MFS transporter [Gaiellaceae bacterium]|nr:MFS transporter [Gaiellaceae bacterium]
MVYVPRGATGSVTIRLLEPLRVRDFRLLWAGMTISALGDGIYTVALAWQVYDISNTPTALSLVGVAWFVPQIAAVLLAGAIADRVDRRLLMITADVLRAVAIGVMGVLSVAGELELWHAWVLVALYGVGNSFFYPAYTALVPQVLSKDLLVQAAALRQFVRPLSMRVIGPALGGAIVAAAGPGTGFLVDAGSFVASTVALLLMSSYPLVREAGRTVGSVLGDMVDGLRYVLSQRWLSLTLLGVTLSMLFFLGPVFVLMPFVVRNHLHGGAEGLGLVLAAGGIGALIASIALAQRGLPRRPLVVVYVGWAVAAFCLIGYAESAVVWEAALVSALSVGSLITGQILWESLLQKCVPTEYLGRVASADSFVSSGLAPLSLAITGPVAGALGSLVTLRWAGIISGAILLCFLLIVSSATALQPRADPGRA